MRAFLLTAILMSLGPGAVLSAQGSQAVLGGGCQGFPAPLVTGPLSVGSQMEVQEAGCYFIGSPGSFYALAFGVPLPAGSWLPIYLQQLNPVLCEITVLPTIVVPSRSEPIRLMIPNAPALRGVRVGLQTYCLICGFRGCDQILSQGLEITIG